MAYDLKHTGEAVDAAVSAVESGKVVTDNTVSSIALGEAKPASADAIAKELQKKVDKVDGKGLSSNDYTDAAVAEVEKIPKLQEEMTFEIKDKLELIPNTYYNASSLNVGDTFERDITSGEGSSSIKIAVRKGQIYRLVGVGNLYARKGWFIVDGNKVISRIGGTSDYDLEITIESGETFLYVNCLDYDTTTQGVWLIKRDYIKNTVENLQQKVDANAIEIIENITKIELGGAYNLGVAVVGEAFADNYISSEGKASLKTRVYPNSVYLLRGIGSQYAYRFYAFLDKDNIVLEVSTESYDTRLDALELTPPQGAYSIIVNFTNYDATVDGIEVKTTYNIVDVCKPLSGKNIVCFGDSITRFMDKAKMRYSDYLEHFGATVTNVGIGGTQFRQREIPSLTPSSTNEAYAGLDIASLIQAVVTEDYSIVAASASFVDENADPWYSTVETVTTLKNVDWSSIDIVTFFAGTNDWNNGNTLGSPTEVDQSTTLGAINYIIQELLTKYPHLRIFWFTPIVRYQPGTLTDRVDDNWGGVRQNSEGKTLEEYVSAIEEVVKASSIPVCDMYHTLGWNKWNFSQFFDDYDGTHPYKGFEAIAMRIKAFIISNS